MVSACRLGLSKFGTWISVVWFMGITVVKLYILHNDVCPKRQGS